MIAAIEGTLVLRGDDWAIIKVGGVSLQVYLPVNTFNQPGDLGETVQLYTHLNVKEDGMSLYGFLSQQELNLFKMLTSVNGIGPKVALAILSHLNPEQLSSAIAGGDVDLLTQLPGIGRKTAQRLVLELKAKLEKWAGARDISVNEGDAEVVAALTNLGYSVNEATQALGALPPSPGLALEEKIGLALQHLAKQF
ncbi:Holliday junction branch migration protein RuvA [Chloroflexota bacterium]